MDDDDDLGDLTHATPAYRRALWIVVLLNVGYGIGEVVGGFVAGSQALKADALDFLGDGTITMLGLMAIGWGAAWRARAALLQGVFLAIMGVGVLATTVYHVFVLHTPESGLMVLLGVGALVVNLSSATVLMKHRSGDANVRAVWLLSRNDAAGNLAVVAAAFLVWLTSTPWPDLIAAAAIAGLFLHSSWEIVKGAGSELAEADSN
jgi:cation diffusion facilitator family transporter